MKDNKTLASAGITAHLCFKRHAYAGVCSFKMPSMRRILNHGAAGTQCFAEAKSAYMVLFILRMR
jgi:hypothetical protein